MGLNPILLLQSVEESHVLVQFTSLTLLVSEKRKIPFIEIKVAHEVVLEIKVRVDLRAFTEFSHLEC
jgi:hypothetical protein